MRKWIITTAFSLLLLHCSRPTQVAGGSTTTDNAKVTGSVFYATGAPAKGAAVRLRAKNFVHALGSLPDSLLQRDTTTNDSGRFFIDSLKIGDYRIEVNDRTSEAILLNCRIASAKDSVAFPGDTLRPYTAIAGKVDSSQLGKASLYVQLLGVDRLAPVDSITGAFSIADLPPATYSVRIISMDVSVKPIVVDSVVTGTGVTTIVIDTNKIDIVKTDTSLAIDTVKKDTSGSDSPAGTWTRVDGPFVISFSTACANAQGIVFVGSPLSNVYYSADHGATWSITINGLMKNDISCLATALKSNDGTMQVYAGARSGGIYQAQSTAQWTSLTAGSTAIDNTGVLALAVNEDGSLIFAGTAENGIIKSVDKGATWTAIDKRNGFPDSAVYCMAMIQDAGGSIAVLAGTPQKGVYRSIDTGKTWTNSTAGLQDAATECIISGTDRNRVFAGNRKGIFASLDKGVTWTQALSQTASGASVPSVALTASGPNVFAALYGAGVFRSADSGVTWTPINAGLPNRALRALAVSGDRVFSCPENYGVYSAATSTSSWGAANSGFPNESFCQIVSLGTQIFVRTFTGIFRSTDNGSNWTRISDKMPPIYGMSSFAVCHRQNGGVTLYAPYNDTLFASADSGASWTALPMFSPDDRMVTVSVAGTTIFACFDRSGTVAGARAGQFYGLLKSTDYGASWTQVAGIQNYVYDMVAVPDSAGAVSIFLTTMNNAIARSTDGGNTWTFLTNGLSAVTGGVFGPLSVNSYGKGNPVIFMGTRQTVFRSSDNGENWTQAGAGFPVTEAVSDVCVCPNGAGGAYVFAGTEDGAGVYYSTDNGENWQVFNTGAPGDTPKVLAVHNNHLWLGGNNLWKTLLR